MTLSFRARLFLPLVISWLCLLGISGANLLGNKAKRLEERQIALRFATETGMSTIKEYAELARSGALPLEQAQQQALARLKAMRYGKDGYYTIISSHPKMVMHPIKAELIGKDVSDFKDAHGYYLYRNVAQIAKTTGEGWVEYVWPKPGHPDQQQVFAKGAYVLTYKPWDWTFLTGVYMDDLGEAFRKDLLEAAALLALIGVALSGIVFVVIRGIERSIGGEPQYATRVAKAIAAGDLSADLAVRPGDDASLLHAMKTMRDGLLDIVGQVRGGAEAISTASAQIASGNHDLSSRTEQQASSLQETASSMEELTATVKQNAENARQANALAESASGVAARGGAVIGQVVGTMQQISESAGKVVDIIAVIDGIAFQTNILALNAAVEAARAGESGRGFAVVASEVRTLAQRSAEAAREIKSLIADSAQKVQTGSQLVDEAGTTMREIVESVRRVTDIMAEISAASAEQTGGIEQINSAVAQMDQVTQQNAALVEQAAAASQAMQEQAANLARVVSVFNLGATGAPAGVGAAAPARAPAGASGRR